MDRDFNVDIKANINGDTSLLESQIKALEGTPIKLKIDGDLKNFQKKLNSGLDVSKGISDGIKKASQEASNILKQSLGKNKKGEDVLFGDVVKNMNSQINALSTNIKGALSFKDVNGKQVADGFKIAGLENTISKLKEIKTLSSSFEGTVDTPKIDFSAQEKQLESLNKSLKKTKSDIKSTVSGIQDIFPAEKTKVYISADDMVKDFNGKSSRLHGDMDYYFRNRGETPEDFEKYNSGQKLNFDKLDKGENYFAQYLALGGDVSKLNTEDRPTKTWIDEIKNDVSAERSKIKVLQQQETAQKSQIVTAEKSLELAKQESSAIQNVTKATQEATKVDKQATQVSKKKNDNIQNDGLDKNTGVRSNEIDTYLNQQREAEKRLQSLDAENFMNSDQAKNNLTVKQIDEYNKALRVREQLEAKISDSERQPNEKTAEIKSKYDQIMRTMTDYNNLQDKITNAQNADNGTGSRVSEIQAYADQMQDAEKRLRDLDVKSFMNSDEAKNILDSKQLDDYNKSLATRAQLEAKATDAENKRNLDSQKSDYSNQISQLESSLKNSGSLTDTIKQQVNGLKDSVNSLSSSNLSSFGDQFNQEISRIKTSASEAKAELDLKKQALFESNIKSNLDDGTYDVKLSKMESDLYKYNGQESDSLTKANQQIETYKNSLNDLKMHMDSNNPFKLDADGMDKTLSKMNDSAKTYGNTMKIVGNEMTKTLDPNKATALGDKISKFYDNNSKAVRKYGDELKRLEKISRNAKTVGEHAQANTQFNTLASAIRSEGLTGKSFLGEFATVGKRITEYVGAYEVFQEGLQVMRQMGTSIKEVDDSMMNLKMATGINNTEAKNLMSTYSDLGDELKATGTDVTTSATEWLKQGKTQEEAATLAEDSIVLSKIGGLTSEESTSYLTSAMKGYKVEAKDALGIVDKLSTVDMASATDVGGLAEGMSRVATNSDLAGVSMDKLLGYLATVGEVTQKDMSSVGKSFSTMFSRMGNIKLGRLDDFNTDETADLSNVETVLRGQGIELRDGSQSFRNFGEVLDEVSGKWKGFSEVGKRAIAQAFAGTNHMENFLVLMENYDKAMEYSEISTNSSGTAMEKFGAYQESLGGKLEGFKNQFQEFSTTVMNGEFMGGVVEGGSGALDMITQLIDSFGSLNTLIAGIGLFQGLKGGGRRREYRSAA